LDRFDDLPWMNQKKIIQLLVELRERKTLYTKWTPDEKLDLVLLIRKSKTPSQLGISREV